MNVDHDYHPLELMPFLVGMDIILMEGFKEVNLPKIEVCRGDNGAPPACRGDKNLIAVVSDSDLKWGVPRFSPDSIDGLAAFVLRYFGLASLIAPFREQKFR